MTRCAMRMCGPGGRNNIMCRGPVLISYYRCSKKKSVIIGYSRHSCAEVELKKPSGDESAGPAKTVGRPQVHWLLYL